MKRLTLLLTLSLASTLVAAEAKPSYESAYGVIEDRNPFLRERHKPVSIEDLRKRRDTDRRPSRTTAQSYVLRGVAIEDDALHAYFEDNRGGGGLIRVSPGDVLGDGRVVDLVIDAVGFEQNGHVQWVEVGQDLTGTRSIASSPAGPTTAASQPTSGTLPAPLPPGGGTLEERMKARRQQQRGNK